LGAVLVQWYGGHTSFKNVREVNKNTAEGYGRQTITARPIDLMRLLGRIHCEAAKVAAVHGGEVQMNRRRNGRRRRPRPPDYWSTTSRVDEVVGSGSFGGGQRSGGSQYSSGRSPDENILVARLRSGVNFALHNRLSLLSRSCLLSNSSAYLDATVAPV
jgi:hypothetical protein